MQPEPTPAPRRSRWLRFTAIASLFLLTPVFVFGATVAATGSVTVTVHERGPDGSHLWIPVPALLLDLALLAAPRLMPEEALRDMRRETAPYRDLIAALAADLERMPAGSVLVEVEGEGEHVRVVKQRRSFEIEVDADGTRVHVSVPARLISRSLEFVAG